ncbi:AtpZ/AtpI family protein [Deferrisoma camini]|uniref:AtpZ/AtpI family protein n=1 Tax=Deferrisoma camini TaxID=1035120 RepID=UPI00046CE824|nr:AtpZ/AtpI family protein [Deferrisoma camini]
MARSKKRWGIDPKELKDLSENLGLVTHLGLTMAAAVGIGLAIGHGLDRWMGTGGLWKAVFIPLGALSGIWTVYRIAMDAFDKPGRRRNKP